MLNPKFKRVVTSGERQGWARVGVQGWEAISYMGCGSQGVCFPLVCACNLHPLGNTSVNNLGHTLQIYWGSQHALCRSSKRKGRGTWDPLDPERSQGAKAVWHSLSTPLHHLTQASRNQQGQSWENMATMCEQGLVRVSPTEDAQKTSLS